MITTTKLPPPSTAMSIAALVPVPVRLQMKWRPPADARLVGNTHCLLVGVGSGVPLRWLMMKGDEDGRIWMRLWEVRQDSRTLAEATVESDRVASTLQQWATLYLTGEPADAVGGLKKVGVKG